MNKSFISYFIPLFLPFYIILSFVPFVSKIKVLAFKKRIETEIFPFFCFRLYNEVPDGFTSYEVVYNYGEPDQHFLLWNNKNLDDLERKIIKRELRNISKQHQTNQAINLAKLRPYLKSVEKVSLVKLSGDYIKAERDKEYQTEIIQVIY